MRDIELREILELDWLGKMPISGTDVQGSHHRACTKTARGGRALTLKPQAQHIAMLARRAEQKRAEFKEEYQRRAGVEGTVSQGVRVGGLRQSRYIRAAKTRLQHILTAVALNLVRIVEWLEELPRARTRVTPFAALARRQRNMTVAMVEGF